MHSWRVSIISCVHVPLPWRPINKLPIPIQTTQGRRDQFILWTVAFPARVYISTVICRRILNNKLSYYKFDPYLLIVLQSLTKRLKHLDSLLAVFGTSCASFRVFGYQNLLLLSRVLETAIASCRYIYKVYKAKILICRAVFTPPAAEHQITEEKIMPISSSKEKLTAEAKRFPFLLWITNSIIVIRLIGHDSWAEASYRQGFVSANCTWRRTYMMNKLALIILNGSIYYCRFFDCWQSVDLLRSFLFQTMKPSV